MATPHRSSLDAALAPLFDDAASGASWFALTGGQPLFEAGDEADTLYLVKAGRLGVFREEEGKETRFLGVVRPGEPAGEMSLLAGTPHTATVVALRDSEVAALPRQAFLDAVGRHPEAMIELARLMVARARDTDGAGADPSVFGFISARARPIRPFVDRVRGAIEALGFSCEIVDHGALTSVAEWFSRIEESHDYVLYVAEREEIAWARLCARQVDRLFIVGDALQAPPASAVRHAPILDERGLTDLILLRDARMERPANTGVWIDAVDPARWFHARDTVAADVERIARIITAQSVGLVLSGGGARAYAEIGALHALRDAGTPVDFLGGASMGALIAAGIAMGWSDDELEHRVRDVFVRQGPLTDIALPIVAMTRGRKVMKLLKDNFGDIAIEDMPFPFFCVSSNLSTGGVKVYRRGSLVNALRASISLPGVMPPVMEDDQIIVDGGVLKNFPVDIMRALHLGPVVGVDVTIPTGIETGGGLIENPDNWWRWLISGEWKKGPPIVSILMRSATVTTEAELAEARKITDVLILPDIPGVEIRDWKAYEPAVEAGWAATVAALSALDGPVTTIRRRKAEAARSPAEISDNPN